MSIMYDYAIAPVDDHFLVLVEHSVEINVKALRPKVAAVVTEFPILKKLPPWFPGVSFVRDAIVQRTLVPMIMDMPFEHVKNNMATAGTAAPSVVSDALKRILVKTQDEEEAAILERGIKESSASGYVAASETVCFDMIYILAIY
ncbi:uncharacterized protein F5147DRAFT_725184 [Suillus discolor]|uniref:Uncharacterized protein n=1 Tax=Suillus discolor TaxID=1912936 RepID=A0A9P7ETI9_9AGAM|nr:uncharacterized protein F5147DRAFT_725184 [Suillus discolor]KAG2089996.1 hypothetical protein F5147DRAFT_725184 [Suillus discolor]